MCSLVGVVEVPLGLRHCWGKELMVVTAVHVEAASVTRLYWEGRCSTDHALLLAARLSTICTDVPDLVENFEAAAEK